MATAPRVGIGYRYALDAWLRENLHCFDTLEITVDHCLNGGEEQRDAILAAARALPTVAHGIGLSIGTDVPLDLRYLDEVARWVERIGASLYSEHLAFTRVPGRELANLLPVPRTQAVAEAIAEKVRVVRSLVPVPFLLENIASVFEWQEPEMDEAAFLKLILAEAGAGLLLDVENVRLNALNHSFDAGAFIDSLPAGIVRQIHVAGGVAVEEAFLNAPFVADSHSFPVPDETLALLDRVLARHTPDAIIVERDERLFATGEILDDLAAIRARLDPPEQRSRHGQRASD